MSEADKIVTLNERKIEMICAALKGAFGAMDIPVEEISGNALWGNVRIKFDDHHESQVSLPQDVNIELGVMVVMPDWNP